jgi:hypothetical protein
MTTITPGAETRLEQLESQERQLRELVEWAEQLGKPSLARAFTDLRADALREIESLRPRAEG